MCNNKVATMVEDNGRMKILCIQYYTIELSKIFLFEKNSIFLKFYNKSKRFYTV